MGFYGNITNTNKTQFTFDKIYSSRKAMDDNANGDGIYLGRYVLIEYDSAPIDQYIRLYKDSNRRFYLSSNYEVRVKYSIDDNHDGTAVQQGQIIYIINAKNMYEFYKCTGRDSEGWAVFDGPLTEPNYTKNYKVDVDAYGEGRGYDSTVWQKVYVQDKEKYVMIAELNTVVPTFDLQADAPTMEPITPHFDTNSTNVYYKLHW